jgi:hypothetical protein
MLLQRMGLGASDTRPIKKANLSGAELLLLSEQQLVTLLDVPLHKARKLMRLQVGALTLCWPVWETLSPTCISEHAATLFVAQMEPNCADFPQAALSDRRLVLHLL